MADLIDEPVDSSDDDQSFVQTKSTGSGLLEVYMGGVDTSGWTKITRAVLRVRGRLYDFSGSAVEKGISFTVRSLTSFESVLFTSPSAGQCSSSGWKTYEVELDILNDDAALWSGVILDMDGRSSKVAAVQVSAVEICIEGE